MFQQSPQHKPDPFLLDLRLSESGMETPIVKISVADETLRKAVEHCLPAYINVLNFRRNHTPSYDSLVDDYSVNGNFHGLPIRINPVSNIPTYSTEEQFKRLSYKTYDSLSLEGELIKDPNNHLKSQKTISGTELQFIDQTDSERVLQYLAAYEILKQLGQDYLTEVEVVNVDQVFGLLARLPAGLSIPGEDYEDLGVKKFDEYLKQGLIDKNLLKDFCYLTFLLATDNGTPSNLLIGQHGQLALKRYNYCLSSIIVRSDPEWTRFNPFGGVLPDQPPTKALLDRIKTLDLNTDVLNLTLTSQQKSGIQFRLDVIMKYLDMLNVAA